VLCVRGRAGHEQNDFHDRSQQVSFTFRKLKYVHGETHIDVYCPTAV
jgi:hypothetical protein